MKTSSLNWRRLNPVLLLLALVLYLVVAHYIKAYSDPSSYVLRAEHFGEGHVGTRRALVYPAVLWVQMLFLGSDAIYLANLPFVVLLVYLVGRFARSIASPPYNPGSRGFAAAGICMVLMVVANRHFLPEIVNPFREPLAFSLMIGGYLCLLRLVACRRAVWAFPTGLLLGLATSTRETCILACVPAALFALSYVRREEARFWIRVVAVAAVGGTIGLAPLVLQNYLHSGHPMLPSYAAEKVVRYAERARWDIPIPGMSLRNFARTFDGSLALMLQKYSWAGLGLFAWGCTVAAFRRHRAIWLLLLPSLVINLLFYSFYFYVKERYLLVVELFALPVMAYGAAELIAGVLARLPARRPAAAERAVTSIGYVLLAGMVVVLCFAWRDKVNTRLQLWHLPEVRRYLEPAIEPPATFVGGRHMARLFAWLTGGSAHELSNALPKGIPPDMPVDDRIAAFWPDVLTELKSGNLYIYGDHHHPPLLRRWTDTVPVLGLADLSAPLDHYGHKLDGTLHRVTPWSRKRVEAQVSVPAGDGLYVLMADAYQLWDYPDRTFCRLELEDTVVLDQVTNGVQFAAVRVDPASTSVKVALVSDAPLPTRPVFRIVPAGQPLELGFGMESEPWCYPLVDPDMLTRLTTGSDGCGFVQEGHVNLPVLARTNQWAFAEFRFVFNQDHPNWQARPYEIQAQTDVGYSAVCLPPPRMSRTLTVPLGPGTGDLAFTRVEFGSTLPSPEEQRTPAYHFSRQLAFVKLYDVRVFTREAGPWDRLLIDFGSEDDGLYIVSGMYGRERLAESGLGRWTRGRFQLRLPLENTGKTYLVEWVCRDARPPGVARPEPRFRMGDHVLEAETVTADGVTTYRFTLEPDMVPTDGNVELTVDTGTWSPSDVIKSGDHRNLGLLIDHLRVEPVDPVSHPATTG